MALSQENRATFELAGERAAIRLVLGYALGIAAEQSENPRAMLHALMSGLEERLPAMLATDSFPSAEARETCVGSFQETVLDIAGVADSFLDMRGADPRE